MTCQQVIDFLSSYLEGSLPWRQRVVFWLHLFLCRHCRRYVASYRQSMSLAREAYNEDRDESHLPIPNELVQAILKARK